jgi:hypothetical protein
MSEKTKGRVGAKPSVARLAAMGLAAMPLGAENNAVSVSAAAAAQTTTEEPRFLGAGAPSAAGRETRLEWLSLWAEQARDILRKATQEGCWAGTGASRGVGAGWASEGKAQRKSAEPREARRAASETAADDRCDWALGRALAHSLGEPTRTPSRGAESPWSIAQGRLFALAMEAPDSIWSRESWLAERVSAWLRAQGKTAPIWSYAAIAKGLGGSRATRAWDMAEAAFGPGVAKSDHWIGETPQLRQLFWNSMWPRLEAEGVREWKKRNPERFEGERWVAFANLALTHRRLEAISASGLDGRPLAEKSFNGLKIKPRWHIWSEAAQAGDSARLGRQEKTKAGDPAGWGMESVEECFWGAASSIALASGHGEKAFAALAARHPKQAAEAFKRDWEISRRAGDLAFMAVASAASVEEMRAAEAAWILAPESERARPAPWAWEQLRRAVEAMEPPRRGLDEPELGKAAKEAIAKATRERLALFIKKTCWIARSPRLPGMDAWEGRGLLSLALAQIAKNAKAGGAAFAAQIALPMAVEAVEAMAQAGMASCDAKSRSWEALQSEVALGETLSQWLALAKAAKNGAEGVKALGRLLGQMGYEPDNQRRGAWSKGELGRMLMAAIHAGEIEQGAGLTGKAGLAANPALEAQEEGARATAADRAPRVERPRKAAMRV